MVFKVQCLITSLIIVILLGSKKKGRSVTAHFIPVSQYDLQNTITTIISQAAAVPTMGDEIFCMCLKPLV